MWFQAPATPRLPGVWPVRRSRRPSSGPLSPGSVLTAEPSRDELRHALGDPVLDAELLELALTHRSYAYENGGLPTNERLEFLGDSVLGVIITETLYTSHPDLSEGRLAKLRAAVVSAGHSLWQRAPSAWGHTSTWARVNSPPVVGRRHRSSPTPSKR